MLVFIALAVFVGGPLLATGTIGVFLFDALFALLLVSGVVTVARRPVLTAIASILTAATVVLRWVSLEAPESGARIWASALTIVLLLILAVMVLLQVFKAGPVTSHRIQGAIVVYLLIGLAWAAAFELVHHVSPGAFHLPSGTSAPRPTHGFLYFSFVTLTTLGYGDITPLHPVARSLAMVEAVTGQLYLTILIARLVSMQLESRRQK
jgi:Ion channel